MVAQNVHSHHSKALRAMEGWKMAWTVVTFKTEEDCARQVACSYQISVETVFRIDRIGAGAFEAGRSGLEGSS